jgi:hypothetical protein
MQRAEQCTFQAPQGQVFGRAGRRSTLEDGERALDWCIEVSSTLRALSSMTQTHQFVSLRQARHEISILDRLVKVMALHQAQRSRHAAGMITRYQMLRKKTGAAAYHL